MGFTGVLTWRLLLIRAAMGLLALLYLFVIIASHSIPLSSALEVPLAAAGWVALVLFALTSIRRLTSEGLTFVPRMSWSWIPNLAFTAVAGLSFYFALTGNLPLDCPRQATSCIKIDNWKMSDGHYYRQFPYDSAGNDDPGAAWAGISRPEYVAEVGTRLRQAAPFGVGALCLAWLLAGTFARDRDYEERSHGDIELAGSPGSAAGGP